MLEDSIDSNDSPSTVNQVRVTEAKINSGAIGTALQVIQNKLMD